MFEIDSAGDQQMIDAVYNRSEQGLNDMARTYGSLLYTVSMNLLIHEKHERAATPRDCVMWNTM